MTEFVSDKTQTKFEINRLYITPLGKAKLEGIYVEDKNQDTLLYAGEILADVAWRPLLAGNVDVKTLELKSITGRVHNNSSDSSFNFQFLIDAFASEDSTNTTKEVKQTNESSSTQINVRHIRLENIDLSFQDISVEMKTYLKLGELELSLDEFNLDSLHFNIEELALQNVQGNYSQGKAFLETEEEESESSLPKIEIQKLNLNNIGLSYETKFDSLQLSTLVELLAIENSDVDLTTNIIGVEKFMSKINHFQMLLPVVRDTTSQAKDSTVTPFQFPDYELKLGVFDFNLGELNIKAAGKTENVDGFNPDDMQFQNIGLKLEDASYKTEELSVEHLFFTAQDQEKFQLHELSGSVKANANAASLKDLKVQTARSILQTNITLDFSSIDSLMQGSFYKTQFAVDLNLPTSLDLSEAFYFSPALKEDSSFLALSKYPAKLYGKIRGNDKAINVQQFRLLYGDKTSVALNATVENWQEVDNLSAILETVEVNSNVSDFQYFLPKDYPDYYPQKIALEGNGSYKKGNVIAAITAEVDGKSKVKLKGNFNADQPEKYQADLVLTDLDLARWLQDSLSFNTADIDISVKGKGLVPEEMNTQAEVNLRNFSYMGNEFDTLNIGASIVKTQLELSSNYSDSIVEFDLSATGSIDSVQQKVAVNLNLTKLNLMALHLSDSLLWASTKASVHVELDSLHQQVEANITETRFVSAEQNIAFNPLKLIAYNSEDSANIKLNWEKISFDFNMNHSFDQLVLADLDASKVQTAKIFQVDTSSRPMRLAFSLDAEQSQSLTDFLPLDFSFKPISAKGNYNSEEELINFQMEMPQFRYENIELDSLSFHIDNSANEFHISTNFQRLSSGNLSIYPTRLKADIAPNKKAVFNLFVEDALSDSLFYVDAFAERKGDSLFWSFDPDKFILNAERWNMDPANRIYADTASLQIQNLIFERNQQLFEVKTALTEGITSLQLKFENFEIDNFFAIINAEESPVKGVIKGEIELENLQNLTAFSASLKLDSLRLLDEEVGNLSLNAEQESDNRYAFDLSSKGAVNITSKGWFDNNTDVPEFDLSLVMDSVSLSFMTAFSSGLMKKAKGNLIGDLNFSGTTKDFVYGGRLNFQEASIFFPFLNMTYELPNEEINLKNEQIQLNNFTIIDEQNNKMQLNGKVTTQDLLNPKVDLQLTADNFQLLNSTKENSDLFYGKAFFSADIEWRGSMKQPKLKATVSLNDKTDLVYIIPESQVDVVEQEGIVTFKSPFQASDTISSAETKQSRSADIDGVELNAIINTHKKAKFKVVVDERRGDYLTVSGDTDLNLILRKNGAVSLNGNVEVNEGFYQLSLYDLVKRKFDIESGSRISWSGDPAEATLDIIALYKTETPVNTLMEDQISSSSSQVKNQYRQKLPFLVQLFIGGNLTTPEISFGLDMPKDSRGALGGNVYQQIQAINSDENRLNKQVFSLLVLNQFFPSGSSNGGASTEAIARNSASQILSNQLNKLSGQYVKGVNLNLDLNSYEDYQSGTAQERTQLDMSLSKNLFNDRFRVEIGSQVDLEGQKSEEQRATDIIGNILVEYLLTEDGRYKLRGYRKNEYEGVIGGQVVVTGISIQFSKEFEKFNEFWEKTEEKEK